MDEDQPYLLQLSMQRRRKLVQTKRQTLPITRGREREAWNIYDISCVSCFSPYPAEDDQRSRGKVDRDQEGPDVPAEVDLHPVHAVVLCNKMDEKTRNNLVQLTLLAIPNPPTKVNLLDIHVKLKVPLACSIIAKLTIDLHLVLVISICRRRLIKTCHSACSYLQLDRVKRQT